jgi:hypothetical protein
VNEPDPTKPDLSLVDTEWMIEEIMNRHHAVLIVREIKPDDESHDLTYDFSGGVSTCIGLAERVKARLLEYGRPTPEEES